MRWIPTVDLLLLVRPERESALLIRQSGAKRIILHGLMKN